MKKQITFLLLLLSLSIQGAVTLPVIFGNNMLLQQATSINLWGRGAANQTIIVTNSWSKESYRTQVDAQGSWRLVMQTPKATKTPQTITFVEGKQQLQLSNVLIGEVWLCSGQSNMEMPMKGFKNQPITGSNSAILRSKNSHIRLFTVKRAAELNPQTDVIGSWQEATPETVSEFSATAYYYGKQLYESLDVPVGLISSAWGGSCVEAWMSKEMLSGYKEVPIPMTKEAIVVPNRTPIALYNGMIAPLIGYTIKGAIWYQGESNYEKADQYASLFTTMVAEWRAAWKQGLFPFYFCQIAPYDYATPAYPNKQEEQYNSAYLREAQAKAAKQIPNSGMAVLMDIGEQTCIHPKNKQTGSERLALLALVNTYGLKGVASQSPTYKEMQVADSKAILTFDNAPMWLTANRELTSFELAGADKQFYPAKARINRSKVEVWAAEVPNPVAVRYAFKDFVVGDLFSTEGLPVSSFRSDEW